MRYISSRGRPAFHDQPEGCVFFFFSQGESADYEEPHFRDFCEACANVRRAYPSMTAAACRTLLSVACGDQGAGLTYESVARMNDLEYIQALHHIELLSSGRRGKAGLDLLIRIKGDVGNTRLVKLSEKGEALVRLFAPQSEASGSFETVIAYVAKGPLQAFRVVVENLPGITLGTLSVFLHVGLKQRDFGVLGVPAKVIAKQLGVPNFPRHIAALGPGLDGGRGYGVINLVENSDDRRIKLPEVTPEGHRILHTLASAVLGREIDRPRKRKDIVFKRLTRPEDAPPIQDDDPDNWGEIEWGKG